MKNLKGIKAFTIIELLIVTVILAILLLIVPNLDLFVQNAVKKEGVLLVRTIIEQERVYKADNGTYFFVNDNDDKRKKIQKWKTIKTLLTDNKYFRPENANSGEIETDLDETIVVNVSTINYKNSKVLEVEVRASPYSKAAGWHVRGRLIEGENIKDKKGKDVANKIVFEEAKEEKGNTSGKISGTTAWQEISL